MRAKLGNVGKGERFWRVQLLFKISKTVQRKTVMRQKKKRIPPPLFCTHI
jgi:hypothetical protein